MTEVLVRPRGTHDLPALLDMLAAQQSSSLYPLRWPLPFPAEQFIVRPDEEMAWVSEIGGGVVGHVSVSAPDNELRPVFVEALGSERLALLTVLFVGLESLGSGAGARLHDTAVDWILDSDRVPVLDVVPTHERAISFYRRRGWREIGSVRPGWLPVDRPDLLLMTLDS